MVNDFKPTKRVFIENAKSLDSLRLFFKHTGLSYLPISPNFIKNSSFLSCQIAKPLIGSTFFVCKLFANFKKDSLKQAICSFYLVSAYKHHTQHKRFPMHLH